MRGGSVQATSAFIYRANNTLHTTHYTTPTNSSTAATTDCCQRQQRHGHVVAAIVNANTTHTHTHPLRQRWRAIMEMALATHSPTTLDTVAEMLDGHSVKRGHTAVCNDGKSDQ